MIPNHWKPPKADRFNPNKPSTFHYKNSVIDASKQKCIANAVAKGVQAYKFLFDINLEERRNKLWNLFANEESDMLKEWESKIETMDERSERLKQNAKRIRQEKEIERQNLAKEKYNQLIIENDPAVREFNRKLHNNELMKDRQQIEIYKDIQKRQEECENRFWWEKVREQEEKMLKRELNSISKQNKHKSEINEQIKQVEFLKTQNKLQKRQENQLNNEQMKIDNEKFKLEDIENQKNKLQQKLKYKNSLDKQIKYKNCLANKQKELENNFEQTILNENKEILNQQQISGSMNKSELNRHFVDYSNMVKCIENQRKLKSQQLDAEIVKKQAELEKKRFKLENERKKKFVNLIQSINDYQKYQLNESEQKQLKEHQDKLAENKIMESKIQNELAKYQQEKEQRQLFLKQHSNKLLEQIKFNEYLNEINEKEKMLEHTKLLKQEDRYQELLKEIREREALVYQHPWRLK